MQKPPSTRRDFLKHSAAATAAGAGAIYFPWSQPAFANNAANDRPKLGCIGLGKMGLMDARQHRQFADILAICDVDSRHAEAANADPAIGAGKADVYQDYRKVLDRKDIDVVSIVTVDHWHVKIAIEALQAGKHVFCQKPLTLTLEENQLVRNACNKYPKLVFVVGTQQRSTKNLFLRAINMVHKGLLGDIKRVSCNIGGGDTGGPFKKVAPPPQLDWNVWLGQAPQVDYMVNRCHHDFRWWYEYSGGKFTDWGAHHVDIALWALQKDKQGDGPVSIDGAGAQHPIPLKDGYPTLDNFYNTATEFAVKCKFADGVESTLNSHGDNGIMFEGEKGRMFVNRQKITVAPIKDHWDKGKFEAADVAKLYKGKPFEEHKANFYRCIREGGLPVSDVYSHVITMNTCHLAAISARLGREIKWDPSAEKIVGDELAASFFARKERSGFEIPRV